MQSESGRFDLVSAVQAVRDDLIAAAYLGSDEELVFEVGDIHMEFTLEFREDTRVKGGVKAWVVSLDADSGTAVGQVHKVSFALSAKKASDRSGWLIANKKEGDISGFGLTPSPRTAS
ncbi:hypothetical protein OHB54_38680 [Streptomyces sp. NBC_01007]|nr:hypothetical protein OHB54_38680 [Streptomyces sp. NBC_01007]